MKRFDNGAEINEADAKRFHEFVDNHRWIFAKTYAAFCPHEYALRRECRDSDFRWFVEFIWKNGFWARWGKNTRKYFVDEERGWYYFLFTEDFDENDSVKSSMTLINRGSLGQWEIVEEQSLFGSEWICKRLPKDRRKPVN